VRAIPTFPQLRRLLANTRNRTFHLLQKADILTCYEQIPRTLGARALEGQEAFVAQVGLKLVPVLRAFFVLKAALDTAQGWSSLGSLVRPSFRSRFRAASN
jgi:hypothetical protein